MQLREDGLAIDQIVLSPVTYLNNAPGAPKNDTTILPKTGAGTQVTFVRQPYIQRVGDSTAWVVWATREGVKAGKGGQQVAAELVLPEKLKGYSLTGFRGGVDANLNAIMDELKAAK